MAMNKKLFFMLHLNSCLYLIAHDILEDQN